jgi:hypothetical protein
MREMERGNRMKTNERKSALTSTEDEKNEQPTEKYNNTVIL